MSIQASLYFTYICILWVVKYLARWVHRIMAGPIRTRITHKKRKAHLDFALFSTDSLLIHDMIIKLIDAKLILKSIIHFIVIPLIKGFAVCYFGKFESRGLIFK